MAFNQLIYFSSPSKLAVTFKGRTQARWSTNGVQGIGVQKERKSLQAYRTRCSSQKLSDITYDLNHKEGPAVHPEVNKSYHILAAYENPNVHGAKDDQYGLWSAALKKLDAFYRFSRSYALLGTVLAILSMSLLPIEHAADFSPSFFVGLLKGLLPAMFMHFYVVGINQLCDVEIDKINKPSLPLASGEFSRETGIVLTASFCAMSFYMGLKCTSPPLLCALFMRFLLGSTYSINLPWLRWKKHPIPTALYIFCLRVILVPLSFFVHIQKYVLGKPLALTKSVVFATAFTCVISVVIALFKDIPDVDGDRDFGVQSFSILLGQEKVFWLGIKMLLTTYGIAMLVGAASSNRYCSLVTILGHGLLASILWIRAQSVEIKNTSSTESFYMFIWKLFYAEYLLIPFVR